MMEKMNPILRCLLFVVVSSLVFPACVSRLKQKYPDVKSYSLEVEPPAQAKFDVQDIAVKIKSFSATAGFQDRFLVYRSAENTYESDFYNRLAVRPSVTVTENLKSWLAQSRVVRSVLEFHHSVPADYVIEGQVQGFYGDYRDRAHPQAVAQVQIMVTDVRGTKAETLFQKSYSQQVALEKMGAEPLAKGLEEALRKIFIEFEADLKQKTKA